MPDDERAAGGPVRSGAPFMVATKGCEYLIPLRSRPDEDDEPHIVRGSD